MSRYPDVKVQLAGKDGNAFSIAARTRKALERAGHYDAGREYFDQALSGDYDHLLRTTMEWVTVD